MGGDKLPDHNTGELRALLQATPRTLYTTMQAVFIDDFPAFRAYEGLHGPSAIHIFANPGGVENPFPTNRGIVVPLFYGVASHELSHHIDFYGGTYRGLQPWRTHLVVEAGCNPENYLRSMFPPCTFKNSPEEFIASMGNQWFASSKETLKWGIERYEAGNPNPLNQVVYLLALFSLVTPDVHNYTVKMEWSDIAAFEYKSGGVQSQRWRATPFKCDGVVNVMGPDFLLELELDSACHVLDVEFTDVS